MKRSTAVGCLSCLTLLCTGPAALAQPDLRQPVSTGPLLVYPDYRRSGLFYYPPGDLALATDEAGRPDVQLLEMRYYGTRADGHPGLIHFRSMFSFRVVMDEPTHAQLQDARTELEDRGGRVELRPLPIRRLEAAVVYAPIGGERPPETSESEGGALAGGFFESADPAEGEASSYWSERVYTLRLDQYSVQALRWALENSRTLLSFGYAFFADGIAPDEALEELSGSPELVEALREAIGVADSSGGRAASGPVLVHAGVTGIAIDAERDTGLVQSIDINEGMPPGYPVLEIRCYDFRDQLRGDLYEKLVEVEAEAVNGDRVRMSVVFGVREPDLYVKRVRSRFAVRLDRPYRYRVVETRQTGEEIEGAWVERDSWAEMLDVTTPATSLPQEVDSTAVADTAAADAEAVTADTSTAALLLPVRQR